MKPPLVLCVLPLAAMLLTGMDGPRERHGRLPAAPDERGAELPRSRPDAYHGDHNYRRRDQDAAYDATRHGAVLPLREIEGRVVPRMPGASYLGPEFDSGSGTYRLKFMRGGSVTWLDVDGRTGEIVGRSGR